MFRRKSNKNRPRDGRFANHCEMAIRYKLQLYFFSHPNIMMSYFDMPLRYLLLALRSLVEMTCQSCARYALRSRVGGA